MDIITRRGSETFVIKNDNRDFFVRREFSPSAETVTAYEIMSVGFRELELSEIESLGIMDLVHPGQQIEQIAISPATGKPKRKWTRRKFNDTP